MNNHSNFILSPITGILTDAITASAGIGSGIETYPLCDYIMQSIFLKMTGSQEQKMKCVCWELATNDYEYRRKLLADEDRLGECSSYDVKNKIYKRLIDQIETHNPEFDVASIIDRESILSQAKNDVKNIFTGSNLSIWSQKHFNQYNSIVDVIEDICFADQKFLFSKCANCSKSGKGATAIKCANDKNLEDVYKVLYNRRNKCAHNTQSYQQNLPTLKTLVNKDYKYENYFVFFFTLILIDKVFIKLYHEYLRLLNIEI